MARGMDRGKRAISGTWGQLWIDGDIVGECYGLQAKWTLNKEDIMMCGRMQIEKKNKNMSGTGVIKLWKTNSRFGTLFADKMRRGETPEVTVIAALKDPDAYGHERVALYNVGFDELVIANWEAGVVGKDDYPFTFGDFEFLDEIGVE